MVRLRVRVRDILGYHVIIDPYTGVYTKLQTLVRQISPTVVVRVRLNVETLTSILRSQSAVNLVG